MQLTDAPSRRFVKSAAQAPYLNREEEQQLAVRWKEERDQEAMHRLTQAHMRLVISIAAKYRGFSLPMGDLIQEGHVGLLEAAARFDPGREVRFSTYATWWIRASMQDYILRNWSIVRGGTSSAQKTLFFNLRRLRARLSQGSAQLYGEELYRQIATAIGVSVQDVALMDSRLAGSDQSLNAPAVDDDFSGTDRQNFLVCEKPLPDEIVGERMSRERRAAWLRDALSVLSERELQIVNARRLSEEAATLETLGDALGISKERVRQIENKALQKMKIALLDQNADETSFIG